MSIVLAIVIGIIAFLAGIGLAYSLLENRLNAQEQRHRARTRRDIEDLERVSADRMQKRIDALKSQYETQIQQLTQQLESAQAVQSSGIVEPEVVSSLTETIVEPELEPEPTPESESETIVETPEVVSSLPEPIVEPELTPEPEPIVDIHEVVSSLTETIVESEPISEPEPEPIAETPEPEVPPVLATPTYEELPTTLEFSDIDTPSEPELLPVTPSPVTIAPPTPEITLEDLKTIPYSPLIETHIQLAKNLLTLLQNQPHIELSKPLLIQVLKRFSQDPSPQLRELAVLCLSNIRSPLVVPLLRQRLRDTDVVVVKAANQALEPWRTHGKVKPNKPSKLKAKKAKTRSL